MANVVAGYKDGIGNKAEAIQWDGDTTGTLANIKAWTPKVVLNKRGILVVSTPGTIVYNVGVGDWLVMDSNRHVQVYPMPNSQFGSTYVVAP